MVKLYSTGCPRCVVLKKKLQQKGIPYEEENDKDLMVSLGFKEVPILDVDGVVFEFTEAVHWINSK